MSQVVMTISTAPPVMGVYSVVSLVTTMVTSAPTSVGYITSGKQDVVMPPQLILRDTFRGSTGLMCATAKQPQSKMPSQVSSAGKFLFQSLASH